MNLPSPLQVEQCQIDEALDSVWSMCLACDRHGRMKLTSEMACFDRGTGASDRKGGLCHLGKTPIVELVTMQVYIFVKIRGFSSNQHSWFRYDSPTSDSDENH